MDAEPIVLQQFAALAAQLLTLPAAVVALDGEAQRTPLCVTSGLTDETAAAVLRLCNTVAAPDNDTAIVPLSDKDAPIRACAAAALHGRDRASLGTLFVFGTASRIFTAPEQHALADVAALAAAHIVFRREKIEAQHQLVAVQTAQRRDLQILELTASDAPPAQIFARIVNSVELGIPDGICTILRCKGNTLEHVASGPALPQLWLEAFHLARLGPSNGSCGTAAYTGKTVIAGDIATDTRWATPRPLALELHLRACWSAPIFNAQGVVQGTLAVYSDRPRLPTDDQLRIMQEAANLVSIAFERQRGRERLEGRALRDALTGLPNRAVFEDRLGQAIAAAKRTRERVFVGLLDLDRFKLINDTLGHVVGDQLLVEVANRLQQAGRAQDTVARMAGDEFLLLLTGVENREKAEAIARRTLAELGKSFSLSGNEVLIHASLGFCVFPDDATDPTQLLRLADHVMYAVKARQSGVGFYERKSGRPVPAEVPLETALGEALEKQQFALRYQPQIEDGSRVRAAEARLFWNHPQLGWLGRERFIGAADEAGLSISIGTWILVEASRFARRWKAAGGCGRVAVKVSNHQCRDRGFAAMVIGAIAAAGIVPAQLILEISESLSGRFADGSAAAFAELRSYGVHTIIVDFGSASSNLQDLHRLPIDGVMIDRSLLRGSDGGPDSLGARAIVTMIVALGRAFGLEVGAEGVDSELQLAQVRESGCRLAQGLAFAPAMPEDAFLGWSPDGLPAWSIPWEPTVAQGEATTIARLRVALEAARTGQG